MHGSRTARAEGDRPERRVRNGLEVWQVAQLRAQLHASKAGLQRTQADDIYAAAAVAAVEKWQFEPPLRKGQAVLVLAHQEFTFVDKP